MTLDDTLWDLLDKLHLSGFFEKYNIPPILLPILIIAVIAIVALALLMPHGAPVTAACGDGFCNVTAGEDPASCATDCAKTSQNLKAVVVEIANTVSESIDITLRDKAGKTLQKQSGKSQKFTFTGISSEAVSVHAKNPKNSRTTESEEFPVTTDPTIVPFGLPKDFFDTPPVPPSKGMLTLVIKDAATKAPVTATVSIFLRTGEGHALVKSEQIDGIKEISLDSDQWYSIVAEAYGYETYDGRSSSINLESGGENTITAEMTAVPSDLLAQPAMVRVCVLDQDGNLVNGSVKAETLGGSGIGTQGLVSGCTQFEFTSGSAVTLTTTEMASCITSSQELITSPGENTITLNVTCGEPGQARVRLVDENNTVLTSQASITAWYSSGSQITGTGSTGKLAMGEGNYTEFVAISPGVRFYFIITNVPGYSTYTSGTYTVSTLENKSITITLHPPPPVEYNFTFSGISYPNPAGTGSQFTVSVSKVLYGDTDVTNLANVTIGIAGQSCSVTRPSVWTATCTAPQVPGVYDLAISATYNGKNGVTVKSLNVLTRVQGYFTLSMRTLTDNEPPIPMQFDITFNGTPLSALSDSDVTVYYVEGGIQVSKLKLSGSNGLYSLSVDTPYPGEHRLDIKLVKSTSSVMYEQNFTVYFEVELNSLKITPTTRISPRILEPGEAYNAIATIKYNNNEVAGLQNIYITIQGIRTQLLWDSTGHTYAYAFLAPSTEGIYTAQFDLGYQKLSEVDFYVVDTTKSKAEECPISDCQKVPDVRICVYDHRYESMYSEDDTIDCIKSGWVMDVDITHCISAVGSKGDWYESCELDSTDVAVLTDVLNRMPDSTERAMYAGCGDMDNDGDVDNDDLTCLTNVVATKWFGDVGDGTCTIALMGGFCADVDDALPGDYDGDEAIDSTDSATMRVLVSAASAGVTESEELLALADFNGDNNIDSGDQACIDTIAGGGTIPTACLAVYNFGCSGLKGDLTQDGNFSEIDLLLEYWIVYGRTEGNECADMDGDGIYTESDYMCLQALIAGDSSAAEEYCINCIFEMQKYGTNEETGEYLRYGLEVCNDGLDNDCDDSIDEDCTCSQTVSCAGRKRDQDGVPDTNDFQECYSTNYKSPTGWQWQAAGSDFEMECFTCAHVLAKREMQFCERERWCTAFCGTRDNGRAAYWRETETPACTELGQFMVTNGSENGQALLGNGTLKVCSGTACNTDQGCTACPSSWTDIKTVLGTVGGSSSTMCCVNSNCPSCWSLARSTDGGCGSDCDPFLGMGCGSCPFVYSYDGMTYYFDHEAYSSSPLPFLEDTSYAVLEHLRPVDGKLLIKIAEELPETSYTNYVRLFAVSSPAGTRVMPDGSGKLHTVKNITPPLSCADAMFGDCLEELSKLDSVYWASDWNRIDLDKLTDIHSEVTLTFPASITDKVKLVYTGKESGLISFTWNEILFKILGKNNLALLSNDTAALSLMDSFVQENGDVHFSVWDGSKWVEQDSRILETARTSSHLAEISVKPGVPIKIKIREVHGSYPLDFVGIDYSKDEKVEVKELVPEYARTSGGADVLSNLIYDDDKYVTVAQGDQAFVRFADPDSSNKSYIIEIKGYFIVDVPDKTPSKEDLDLIASLLGDEKTLAKYVIPKYLGRA